MSYLIIGLFDEFGQARDVMLDLTSAGIPREQISVIGSAPPEELRNAGSDSRSPAAGATSGAATGAGVGASLGLLASLTSLFVPGLGLVVAAGWIASTAGGAALGAVAGGLFGALSRAGAASEEAGYYVEGVRRGGTLVVVRANKEEWGDIARAAMQRHDVVDIDERVADWRTRGWAGFDPGAAPLDAEELEHERRSRHAA